VAALQDRLAPAAQKSQILTLPPPVGGWNTRDALPNMAPTDAVVALNVLCQPSQVVTRLGSLAWATGFATGVTTIMPFNSAGAGDKDLFAAAGANIYDITAGGAIGAPVVTGLTNGWWQWVNFGTGAGQFLVAVNGADSMLVYTGATDTWAPTATLPINPSGTLNTNTIVNISAYESTLYFVPANALGFYYQAAQSITGTVTFFSLMALCTRGGYLMATGTWTVDGGAGPQDYFVAVTSEGEVAVYQGLAFSIPSGTAGAMQLVGVYYIGRPLGRRCFMKYGGDLLMLTERGLFPLSKGLQAATVDKTIALTDKIEPTFVALAAQTFATRGWQIENCQFGQFLIINVPTNPPQQMVMQFQSKGWSNWSAWNANCFLYFDGDMYYGDSTTVYKCYTGKNDNGNNITCGILPAFSKLNVPGQQKHVKLLRPFFEADGPSTFSITPAVDYAIPTTLNPPGTPTPTTAALWDVALWDVGLWGGAQIQTKPWVSVGTWPCVSFSPYYQIVTNSTTIGLQAQDILFAVGGIL
jgi:hypothetical protein